MSWLRPVMGFVEHPARAANARQIKGILTQAFYVPVGVQM
jgi:hypothetical protein